MRDVELIADLVRAGVSAELVGRVVNEITATMSGTNVRDNIRVYETVRKRNQRKSGGKQTMSAPIEPKSVPDNVPDNAAPSSLTSLLSSSLEVPLATKQGSKREVVARRDRGTRIPADWAISAALRAQALELGVDVAEFEREFRDFWIGVPGTRGRKCDWEATARNRLHEIAGRKRRTNGHGNSSFSAAAERLRARGAELERQNDPGKPDDLLERHERS